MDVPEDKSTATPHSFERTVISKGIWPVAALQPSTTTLIPYTSLPEASWRSRPRNTLMFAFAGARTSPVVRQPTANIAWLGVCPLEFERANAQPSYVCSRLSHNRRCPCPGKSEHQCVPRSTTPRGFRQRRVRDQGSCGRL